jgi:hypothetical protein
VLNFSGKTKDIPLAGELPTENPELLISNYPLNGSTISGVVELQPYEARLYSYRSQDEV